MPTKVRRKHTGLFIAVFLLTALAMAACAMYASTIGKKKTLEQHITTLLHSLSLEYYGRQRPLLLHDDYYDIDNPSITILKESINYDQYPFQLGRFKIQFISAKWRWAGEDNPLLICVLYYEPKFAFVPSKWKNDDAIIRNTMSIIQKRKEITFETPLLSFPLQRKLYAVLLTSTNSEAIESATVNRRR